MSFPESPVTPILDVGDIKVNALKDFAKDLALAQAELEMATKDKRNTHFGSKYADLASVWEAWRSVGPKNGFSVVQLVKDAGDRQGVLIETVLLHKAGASMTTTAFFPANKNDAQGFGSAITYGRRYCLAAMAGVCPDDDDGEAAVGRPNGNFRSAIEAAAKKNWGDKAKIKALGVEAMKAGLNDLADMYEKRTKELT